MLKTAEKTEAPIETDKPATVSPTKDVKKEKKSLGQKIKHAFKIGVMLVVLIVLIVGIVAAGILGYRLGTDSQNTKVKEANDKAAKLETDNSELNIKVDLLNKQLDELGVVTEENQQQLEEKAAQQKKLQDLVGSLPVVFFTPSGSFSADLKKEIRKKITGPLADFYNQKEVKVVTIEVKPSPSADVPGFNVSAFFVAGGYIGFIHETNAGGNFDYWIPECYESICEFTETYKQKHPEVVQKYLSLRTD